MLGLLFVTVVLLDQLTKSMFIPAVYNTSGVFGLGNHIPWTALTMLLLWVLFHWWRHAVDQFEKTTLIVIVASGFSNFYDRIIFGGVRDFIWMPVIGVYGNIADIFLAIAVVFFLMHSIWHRKQQKPVQE